MIERNAHLVLADGEAFEGTAIGAPGTTVGEAVFTTGMTGYQEVLTDPSFCHQVVCMTAPQMGNTGVNGEQGRLFEWDGQRYFSAVVGEDSTDFKNWFSQAAVAAGETGCSFEMMSAAAGYAFHPANAAYNDGFLRDEGAVLVIVVLTDEPDKSPEGAMAYYDMVVQAKAGCGGDQCVLVTGLVDQCIEGANNALWQFFNLFPSFTTTGSIDQPGDYAQVVGSALAQVIGETCDQIPPAG